MSNKIPKQIIFAFLSASSIAFAAGGKVIITSPTEGTVVDSYFKNKVSYEAVPGDEGDHLHLNIDGQRVDVLRELNGTTEVAPLPPGKHQICLALNTKDHVPTGDEQCINVLSE